MWIDVKIPYGPDGQLAEAYNRAMLNTTAPWVLLLDHDVFLSCNPHWYAICLEAIGKAEEDSAVGLLTCVTNGCSDRPQGPGVEITKIPDIDTHVDIAHQLYKTHGSSIKRVDSFYIAGFFMLVNWKVWRILKFQHQGKGVNKIDQDYCKRLLANGHSIYTMPGLYVYHRKNVRKLNWN